MPPTSLSDFALLTPSRARVALQLLTNKTESQIAKELFIALSTVQSHRKAIYSTYSVHTRREFQDLHNPPFPSQTHPHFQVIINYYTLTPPI